MIDFNPDEALLAAVRDPGVPYEPDAAARARAAELDAAAHPDLRGDRDRGGAPTNSNSSLDRLVIERTTLRPERSA